MRGLNETITDKRVNSAIHSIFAAFIITICNFNTQSL